MPLPELNLDDRSFEDIVLEAKRRIPGYTPEWTDQNESDPGMALVQLFAWLSEMIIYRLNKVPEKNYRKFLELIGIELEPAKPAATDLTFTLTDGAPTDVVHTIPANTRVALSDAVEGGPVYFETDDNLDAVAARIVQLRSAQDEGDSGLVRGPDFEGQPFFPFGLDAGVDHRFEIAFDRPLPAGQAIRLTVHVAPLDLSEGNAVRAEIEPATSGAEDELAPGDGQLPERQAPVILEWWWRLETETDWTRLDDPKDTTAGFIRDGTITITGPSTEKPGKDLPKDQPFLWIQARIKSLRSSGYETPPQIERVLVNTVSATNAASVSNELLGASTGLPDQKFTLAKQPVIPSTLQVEIHEGPLGKFEWKRVPRLGDSGPNDRVFTLNAATGDLFFGDGVHGKIPPIDPAPGGQRGYDNITATFYRWGGGARGNAGAGKITGLESAVAYVDSVKNFRSANGGADQETLDEAKVRAPEFIRSRSRAVTSGDFEYLARQTPGALIRRAKALPLYHPDVQPVVAPDNQNPTSLPVPGVVTVIVVPAGRSDQNTVVPTKETLDRVGAWLNRHRLVTTQIFVRGPRYRQVRVEATVKVARNANVAEVSRKLQQELLTYFHPLTGGEDGTGWPFGGTISFTNVIKRMFKVPGIADIPSHLLRIVLDQVSQGSCQDLLLADDQLTYSLEHWLEVSYS